MARSALALNSGNAQAAHRGSVPRCALRTGTHERRLHLCALSYLFPRPGLSRGEERRRRCGEFQKILDHASIVGNEPIGALAHLGLGRAYSLSGDSVKAKTAYQDFLALWKNADPDIPLLTQAKVEYAKLP